MLRRGRGYSTRRPPPRPVRPGSFASTS